MSLNFLPFLFFPVISNPWYIVFSSGLYMVLTRGMLPAWMEVLKVNLPLKSQAKTCSFAASIDYLGAALLPLSLGWTLDNFKDAWSWLFMAAALIGIASTWFFSKIPTQESSSLSKEPPLPYLLNPWKSCWKILTSRVDFFKFQLGFFLGGAGLMLIHPVLPNYFVDTLHLSYAGMLTAIASLKGIGFMLSSPLWTRCLSRIKIFRFCSFVTIFAVIFSFLLIGAKVCGIFVYIAYFVYGIMQGGSELSWKMSGPIFSKGSNSAPYSSVNVLAVGVRGLIFPYLGSFLFSLFGHAHGVILLGSFLCLAATVLMALNGKKSFAKNLIN